MTEQANVVQLFGHLTVQDLRLLALIRSGIDSRPELVKASGIAERTVFRRVELFLGAARYQEGTILPGSPPLVLSRKHPHQAGMQFFLSPLGERLLTEAGGIAAGKRERARA